MLLAALICPCSPAMIEMGMEMGDFSRREEGAGADWGMYRTKRLPNTIFKC